MFRLLFLLTLVGFILGNVARLQLGDGVAITLLDISVFLLVIFWAWRKVLNREKLEGKLLKPTLFFISAASVSLFANSVMLSFQEQFVASMYLVRWIFYICIYYAIKDQDKSFRDKIPKYLKIAGIAHLFIGFFQYVFYSDLSKLYHLGWDEHLYRMFGTFLDPNYMGAFFALFFFLILGQIMSKNKILNTHSGVGYVILSVITLISIVLTYSRSALILLFVGVLTFAVVKGSKRIIGAIIVITVLFIVIFSNLRVEGLNPLRSVSTVARVISVQEALSIIQKNPLFGVGFNAYRYAQVRYEMRNEAPPIVSHADAGTDNSYLFVFATSGIFGLVAFLYLLYSMVILAKNKKSVISLITVASIFGLLVNSLFINSLFFPFILYWQWILLGLT
jgi:hypothetical protein